MNASRVIKLLQENVEEFGDRDVQIVIDDELVNIEDIAFDVDGSENICIVVES